MKKKKKKKMHIYNMAVAILCDMHSLMLVGFFMTVFRSMNDFLLGCLLAVVVI